MSPSLRGTVGSRPDNQPLECFGLALPVRLAGLFRDTDDLGSWNQEVTERGGRPQQPTVDESQNGLFPKVQGLRGLPNAQVNIQCWDLTPLRPSAIQVGSDMGCPLFSARRRRAGQIDGRMHRRNLPHRGRSRRVVVGSRARNVHDAQRYHGRRFVRCIPYTFPALWSDFREALTETCGCWRRTAAGIKRQNRSASSRVTKAL